MDNSNRKVTTIIGGIITALIPSIILLIVNSSVYYFNKENVNISISESTYANGNYNTSISIKNYQKNKSIDKIKLWISEGEIVNIDSNLKNIYDKNNKSIVFEEIIPEYKGTIIIHSNIPINSEKLKIETDTKSNIVFLSEQKESAYIKILDYAVTALIYFIVLSIINIYFKLKQDQDILEIKKTQQKIEENLDKSEKDVVELVEQNKKIKIKYIKIIKDYNRELDFWKDTIRKLLYNSKKQKIKEEDIFREVTMNLKTFHTLDKCNYSDIYEVLKDKDKKSKE